MGLNNLVILSTFFTGLSGIIAQVLLLRELLISFLGNELTLGVILANWLIAEALGVFVIGRLIDKIKGKINIFIAIQLLFALFFPVSVYLSRVFKPLLGVYPGETIGLALVFISSFFIILLPAFCHAALFTSACKLISSDDKQAAPSIGRVYAIEMLGTIIGGIISAYILLPHFNSFQVVLMISIATLFLCVLLLRYSAGKVLKYITIILAALFIYAAISGKAGDIHKITLQRQFLPGRVLDYRNSVYGNIAASRKEGQNTFFYNGIPVITAPFADITFIEDFGHLPLLFHKEPKEILVLGAGIGGLISEILKHPLKKIDYVELDPLLIDMVKKFPTDLTEKELSDKRVNIINADSRFFIRQTYNKYDLVLIGFSTPWDLAINRLFTREFFSLLKARLNDNGGIIAFCLPGSLSYISKELKDLNACILNAVKSSYAYTRVIPGDYNIFLASDSADVMNVTPDLINQKITALGIKTNILIPAYLNYRLDQKWVNWFNRSLEGASLKINQDLMPYAVFQMSVLWNKQFSARITAILNALSNFSIKGALLWVLAMTFVLLGLFKLSHIKKKLSIAYCIATTGFFSMMINLILIFSFQVFYGYVYQMIGVLISVFMAGACLGSILISRYSRKNFNCRDLFIKVEWMIIAFTGLLAVMVIKFSGYTQYSALLFGALFFISGGLTGLEFPIASKIYLDEGGQVGGAVGALYFSDLLGGYIAGILGGIFLLPVLGLFNACMVIILFKLSSQIILLCKDK